MKWICQESKARKNEKASVPVRCFQFSAIKEKKPGQELLTVTDTFTGIAKSF